MRDSKKTVVVMCEASMEQRVLIVDHDPLVPNRISNLLSLKQYRVDQGGHTRRGEVQLTRGGGWRGNAEESPDRRR